MTSDLAQQANLAIVVEAPGPGLASLIYSIAGIAAASNVHYFGVD